MIVFNGIGDYNPDTTILEKIKYVLRNSDQPLTSREISEKLMSMDKELAKNRITTIKNVSTIISMNRGNGKVFKRIEKEGEDNKFELN